MVLRLLGSPRFAAAVLLTTFALGGAACKPRSSNAAPLLRKGVAKVVTAAARTPLPALPADGDEDKKRRYGEANVYVDGQPLAVLRFLELPPSLPVRWKVYEEDGKRVRRYRVAEYLEALGVKLDTVKEIHIYGGRGRISIIRGAELQRVRNDLLFSFTQSERGKPRMHYPSGGMDVNTTIDVIGDLAVYSKLDPPNYNQKSHDLTFHAGGPAIEGIPYNTTGERLGGTRVYVDGVYRGNIKRKGLPDAVVVPGSAEAGLTRYRLGAFLDTLGIDAKAVKQAEFFSDDAVVETLTKDFAKTAAATEFVLPRHSRGRIEAAITDTPHKLDAIALYASTTPPSRKVEAKKAGSTPLQPEAQTRVLSASAKVARSLQK